MKTLFILNGPPYGTEHSYNGLRLAGSVAKRDGEDVRIFLMGDAVGCALQGQVLPDGYYHLDRMLGSAIRRGAEVGCCGTCMDARAIDDAQLLDGARRSTLDELTDWTLSADKVITFWRCRPNSAASWRADLRPRATEWAVARVLDPEGAHLAALRRLADFGGQRVLEMGCGEGRLTGGIAADAAHVLAFDPDAASVEVAERRLPAELLDRVEFRAAAAESVEIERGSFDLVVFSWSL